MYNFLQESFLHGCWQQCLTSRSVLHNLSMQDCKTSLVQRYVILTESQIFLLWCHLKIKGLASHLWFFSCWDYKQATWSCFLLIWHFTSSILFDLKVYDWLWELICDMIFLLNQQQDVLESSNSSSREISPEKACSSYLLTCGRAWGISLTIRGTISEEILKPYFPSDSDTKDENLLYRFVIFPSDLF